MRAVVAHDWRTQHTRSTHAHTHTPVPPSLRTIPVHHPGQVRSRDDPLFAAATLTNNTFDFGHTQQVPHPRATWMPRSLACAHCCCPRQCSTHANAPPTPMLHPRQRSHTSALHLPAQEELSAATSTSFIGLVFLMPPLLALLASLSTSVVACVSDMRQRRAMQPVSTIEEPVHCPPVPQGSSGQTSSPRGAGVPSDVNEDEML